MPTWLVNLLEQGDTLRFSFSVLQMCMPLFPQGILGWHVSERGLY
jgi:hypothetical protein